MGEFSALFSFPWEAGAGDVKIIGKWAEDGGHYEIICPAQLRDLLVELQVRLCAKHNELDRLNATYHEKLRELESVLGQ